MENEKVFYKTSNLNLATTLYTIGFAIDGIYSTPSGIKDFYFALTPELEKAVDDYWKRQLKVEPNTLLTNRKEILEKLNDKNS